MEEEEIYLFGSHVNKTTANWCG